MNHHDYMRLYEQSVFARRIQEEQRDAAMRRQLELLRKVIPMPDYKIVPEPPRKTSEAIGFYYQCWNCGLEVDKSASDWVFAPSSIENAMKFRTLRRAVHTSCLKSIGGNVESLGYLVGARIVSIHSISNAGKSGFIFQMANNQGYWYVGAKPELLNENKASAVVYNFARPIGESAAALGGKPIMHCVKTASPIKSDVYDDRMLYNYSIVTNDGMLTSFYLRNDVWGDKPITTSIVEECAYGPCTLQEISDSIHARAGLLTPTRQKQRKSRKLP